MTKSVSFLGWEVLVSLTTIIIPSYNEEKVIGKVVLSVHEVLEQQQIAHEIIVVDDGSTDNTVIQAKANGARVIRHAYNMGNGSAVKTGIRHARGKVIVLMDGDGQHDPNDIPRLLSEIQTHGMVVGARTRDSETKFHRDLANWIYNLLASYICGRPIPDLTSGFRAIRTNLARQFLYLLPNTFSYPTTITLAVLRAGHCVMYVPIKTTARVGRSKIRLFQDGSRFLVIILKIATLFSPMKIFFPISISVAGLGVFWYLYTFFTIGHRLPSASIIMILAGILFFLIGLISEQISQLRFDRSESILSVTETYGIFNEDDMNELNFSASNKPFSTRRLTQIFKWILTWNIRLVRTLRTMMRILCDISHPAHVHFFRNAIDIWKQRGHEVTIVSRDKDITLQLLNEYNYHHICLSKARQGIVGLSRELLEHEGRLLLKSLRKPPDVFLEIAGTFIVHAAKLVNKPSLVFYDTEHAKLSNAITYPFASAIYTPSCYRGEIGHKQIRYNGYQELAYLHPNYFSPDPKVLEQVGASQTEKLFLIRFVSWEASHDVGQSGFSLQGKRELVNRLSQLGRVVITSEARLPAEFEQFRMNISPTKIHHLMAYSTLYIGESATMASESAILGKPFIFVSPVGRGYTDEQENEYHLGYTLGPQEEERAIRLATELANRPDLQEEWQKKRQRLLKDKIDVTAWMVDTVENYSKQNFRHSNKR